MKSFFTRPPTHPAKHGAPPAAKPQKSGWQKPRFSLWCGTRHTDDWHTRFPVECVVYGHLHIRGTRYRDNVRFEEVSLGYPRQWDVPRGVDAYLREIL